MGSGRKRGLAMSEAGEVLGTAIGIEKTRMDLITTSLSMALDLLPISSFRSVSATWTTQDENTMSLSISLTQGVEAAGDDDD